MYAYLSYVKKLFFELLAVEEGRKPTLCSPKNLLVFEDLTDRSEWKLLATCKHKEIGKYKGMRLEHMENSLKNRGSF